ncbi:hypothetical protein CHUAL_008994 [Chamberlinius hualienensis]
MRVDVKNRTRERYTLAFHDVQRKNVRRKKKVEKSLQLIRSKSFYAELTRLRHQRRSEKSRDKMDDREVGRRKYGVQLLGRRVNATLQLLLYVITNCACVLCLEIGSGPRLVINLPDQVDFSNDTGVMLECRGSGNPPPEVRWLGSDGLTLSSKAEDDLLVVQLRSVLPNGSLIFYPFSAVDYRQDVHAATYRCQLTNVIGTVTSNDVTVRAVVKQFYEIQVYDQYVIAGNTAVLSCQIPPFVQDFVLFDHWEKEVNKETSLVISGGQLQENGKYNVFPDGVLHIRDVKKETKDVRYRCQTQHRLTGETKRSSTAGKVIVTEPTGSISLKIVHWIATVEVKQGEKVRLPCVAEGLPLPTYRWERRRRRGGGGGERSERVGVGGGDKFHLSEGSGTLSIRNVQIEDSAIYICLANNSVGFEKAETNLNVMAPLLVHLEPERQKVDEGKSATFACTISGHPISFVRWLKDGRHLTLDERVKLLSREILQIEGVKRGDRGMYQCVVNNQRQSVQAAAQLKLGDAEPQFVKKFSQQTLSSGSALSLECVAYGNPSLNVKWQLDEMDLHSSQQLINSRDEVVSYLNVSRVKSEDGGVYRCIVSNRLATIQHQALINVYGPPVVRPMSNVSAVAGREAILRCRTAGYPIEIIRWEKDDVTLPANHRQKIFPNGTLLIHQINRLNDAGYYKCMAINRQGQSDHRSTYLSIKTAPLINPFYFPSNLRQGVRAGVQCLIIEGDQPVTINWLKDGQPITDPSQLEITTRMIDDLTKSLIINSLRPFHTGNYTCQAGNSADTVSHTAQLLVNGGSPAPNITWKKALGSQRMTPRDYKVVVSVGTTPQQLTNGSLMFSKGVTESHEGHYLCQASNGVGLDISKLVYLDVLVPAYLEDRLRNESAVKGKSALISCSAKGDEPIRLRWKVNDRPINSNNSNNSRVGVVATKQMTSELRISTVEQRDTAVYQCEASNAYGHDTAKIYLLVKEPPEIPKPPTVTYVSGRSVELSWHGPFDGNSPILRYVIHYTSSGGNSGSAEWWEGGKNFTTPSAHQLTAILKELRPATTYYFRLMAENEVGVSGASEVVTQTTDEEAPQGPPTQLQATPLNSTAIKVTWKPPDIDTWNGKLLGYRVSYRPANRSPSTSDYVTKSLLNNHPSASASIETIEYVINHLKQFTAYVITVESYNAVGVGPKAQEIKALTMEEAPSQWPVGVACSSLSSTQIRVEWQPPPLTSQHGTILGYKIISSSNKSKGKQNKQKELIKDFLGGFTFICIFSDGILQTDNVQTQLLDNLIKFTNYSIKVLAFNSAGDGKHSRWVHCTTHEHVPGPPSAIKALVMSSDAILLSWRPPSSPNGLITKYTAYIRSSAKGNQKGVSHTVPPTQLYYECRGLEEELHYDLWITASTSVGEGEATDVINQSPTSIGK